MKKGFSLIEILTAIAILGIISSIFVYSFRSQIQEKKLEGEVSAISAKLQEAKNLSQSGKNGQAYGVKFNIDSYVTFIGASYDANDENNVTFTIDPSFKIQNTIPGDDDVVIFSKIFGEINTNVDIIISEKNNINNSRMIVIGKLGDISVIK